MRVPPITPDYPIALEVITPCFSPRAPSAKSCSLWRKGHPTTAARTRVLIFFVGFFNRRNELENRVESHGAPLGGARPERVGVMDLPLTQVLQ